MWTGENTNPDSDRKSLFLSGEIGDISGKAQGNRAVPGIGDCDMETLYEMYHYTNGTVMELNGFLDDAIREYRETIKINPWEGFYHYNLGVALLKNDQYNEAFKELTEALRIDPEDFEARCALADVHMAIGNGMVLDARYEEAAAEFRMALSIDPEYPDYHFCLGKVLLNSARSGSAATVQVSLSAAIGEFRAVIGLDPEFADGAKNLGQALLLSSDLGERAEGVRILQTLLTADPLNDDIRLCLSAFRSSGASV